MKLVIVESPTKTHTLKRYLGDEYDVEASSGHIRDLAIKGKNGFGVDVENDFKPVFAIDPKKVKIVANLKNKAKEAEEVILATDPDREGEAIAWHLTQVLNLPVETTKRLEFHEITRDSITDAIKTPRTIDMNLVSSQETRRIIDRIIGFSLSKITYHALKSKSAGRVQSVTLKLICDHEKEILEFVPQKFYTINVSLESDKYKLSLNKFNGETVDKIFDEKVAKEIFNDIGDNLKVTNIDVKNRSVKSKEPFTTSTLQQEAFTKCHFSTLKTMQIAQKLYEGVQLGDELVGLITYMRTDSSKLSNTFIERAHAFISEAYGEKYFSGAKSQKHSQNAQEAHEAIRHTGNHRTPESIKEYLTNDEYKLYSLIYNRALASVMADREDEITTVTLSSDKVDFKMDNIKTLFDGFSRIYKDDDDDISSQFKNIKLNDTFKVCNKELKDDMTKPAPRYSEAKVVKLMEEKGIGRPSTYAPTINILLKRKYVVSEKGMLKPTEQGMLTSKFLEGNFSNFINVGYTADMENKLDEIQTGNDSHSKILTDFYSSLLNEIDTFNKDPKVVVEKIEPVKTGEKCPVCGADLVIREGRYGKFIGCSNYPTCSYIKKEPKKEAEKVGRKCPKCGGELVYRDSRKGRFIACSNFPKCRYTESIAKDETSNDENKSAKD